MLTNSHFSDTIQKESIFEFSLNIFFTESIEFSDKNIYK